MRPLGSAHYSWVTWLSLFHTCYGAKSFFSGLFPSSSEPPLASLIVRQYEQIEWELSQCLVPGPSQEAPKSALQQSSEGNKTPRAPAALKGDSSMDLEGNKSTIYPKLEPNQGSSSSSRSTEKLESSMKNVNLKDQQLKSLYNIDVDALKKLGEAAIGIIGKKKFDGFEVISSFIHISRDLFSGCIVVVYRPALLGADLAPNLLRVLYHSLAQKRYGDLVRYLEKVENLEKQNIILVGALEAGLMANYQAAMLIRSYPRVAIAGEHYNRNNQVQVITFNSPASHTSHAIQSYRIPKDNFLEFHNFVASEAGFGRWGHIVSCNDPSLKDIYHPVHEEGYISELFNDQALGTINEANLLNISKLPETAILASRLANQKNRARSGIEAAVAEYGKVRVRLMQDSLHACASSLQRKLHNILADKFSRSQEFVESYNLESNWSLKETITCTPVPNAQKSVFDEKVLIVECGFGKTKFASYRLTLGADESTKFRMDSGQQSRDVSPSKKASGSIASLEEAWGTSNNGPVEQSASGFKTCLGDLFELFPYLKAISPSHSESSFILPFTIWPHREELCRASIVPSKTLKKIYKEDRQTFVKLMTSPFVHNPQSCQEATDPVPLTGTERTEPYWRAFLGHVGDYTTSNTFTIEELITHATFDNPQGKAQLQRNLFEHISANIGSEPSKRQFDCTDPHTLWHSENFCPKMCRTMVGSNFCNRVYISHNGNLKLSLRAANAYTESWDKSLTDWQTTFQLKKDFEDRASYFLKLRENQSGKIFFLAIYLEGRAYEAFKQL